MAPNKKQSPHTQNVCGLHDLHDVARTRSLCTGIVIEVAYATPEQQRIIECEVVEGCTIEIAIHQSGILTLFPEIDLSKQKVGIFSQQRQLGDIVKAGDRIEIYRPLMIDPKDARRQRAQAQRSGSRGKA